MNRANKENFNKSIESAIADEEIILAHQSELLDDVKEIAQSTTEPMATSVRAKTVGRIIANDEVSECDADTVSAIDWEMCTCSPTQE